MARVRERPNFKKWTSIEWLFQYTATNACSDSLALEYHPHIWAYSSTKILLRNDSSLALSLDLCSIVHAPVADRQTLQRSSTAQSPRYQGSNQCLVLQDQCCRLNEVIPPFWASLDFHTSGFVVWTHGVRIYCISHSAMSTPSTLPPHHPNYGYSHHQNYQSTSGYRASNNLLNGGSRLGAAYNPPTPSSNGTSSNSIGLSDPPRPAKNAVNSPRAESKSKAMPASAVSKPTSKKRQRSEEPRKPDWNNFYKNGLPKEVIVIDDSPPPDPSASVVSNGHTSQPLGGSGRHAAKKRKRNEVGSAYDPVYQLEPESNEQSPRYKNSASGSTISTDRTTSAIHTTAATSLGSHSSNGQSGYEAVDVQPGQKRKRTATRLQLANEAKRKELEVNGDAFTNYKPPPRPPIKAPEVQVKQISDVSHE